MQVTVSDNALQDLSVMFYNAPDDPTPEVKFLSKEKLDFSIESLTHVEEYLDHVRKQAHNGRPFQILVLRAGAYVGEVIRRNARSKKWHWLDYKEASRLMPEIGKYQMTLETSAVLWETKGTLCFPLSKVIKYLKNGSGDSVKFFAQVFTSEIPDGPNHAPKR